MDEKLKAFLLLNYANCDLRAWGRFLAYNAAPSALWKEPHKFVEGKVFSESAADRLLDADKRGWAEREYDDCLASNVSLVAYKSENYPKGLYDLKDAPLILYWQGKECKISENSVGVVGTRRATAYGKMVAYNIGNRAAAENCAVISGGAAGIDGQAHLGCCNAHGKTFAVFGNGIDVIFPLSNRELFERIKECGALISEFPLGCAGEVWHFPRRNRIVSALSKRLVVVEAPNKSGAMITAKLALEQGREIWAVPGRITENSSEGTNRLIFDGAYPLISLDTFFGKQAVQIDFENSSVTSALSKLTEEQKKVFLTIARENDLTVDNIAVATGYHPTEVLKITSMLCLLGLIATSAPGRFMVCKSNR